jgi:ribosomal-protein-alanine N-acetyltransferase
LTPLVPADTEALHQLWTQPGVRRYLWDDEVIAPERTAEIVQESAEMLAGGEAGLWGVRQHEAPALVGFTGYWYFFEPPQRQVLYGLDPSAWGRGLAAECARAMMRYGFETLGFDEVIAATDPPNEASVRVMEKAGLHHWKRETVDGNDTLFYRLPRDAYQPVAEPYRIGTA